MTNSHQHEMTRDYLPEPDHTCGRCGEGYTLIGTGSGACPECGSRVITPIGPARVRNVQTLDEYADNRPLNGVYNVTVTDETDREMTYWVTQPGESLLVTRIQVAGSPHTVKSQQSKSISSDWLPSSLRRQITVELLGEESPGRISLA